MTLNLLSFPDLLGKLSYSDSVFSDSLSPIRMTSTHTTFGSFGNNILFGNCQKKAKVFVLLEAKPFLELIISLAAFMLSSKYQ